MKVGDVVYVNGSEWGRRLEAGHRYYWRNSGTRYEVLLVAPLSVSVAYEIRLAPQQVLEAIMPPPPARTEPPAARPGAE
jgi:hypothetical protein